MGMPIYYMRNIKHSCLRNYINELERQLDIEVKTVRLDRNYEYYGKYDENCP